ncbi:uncharacterized protein Tco025E_07977 [Trypanosoma conorhini]|uniref:Uncharacterized protein n=1 Tax=Trypanosoma conorhini TaxID=83891 RepID=A0A422NGD3_9TRYP|nr:uncharacterized protein Tco025E_07977 [Trypanosoma conorhini]RNF04499.1 hypothetical protein Tco025E_07977 [Trypanosoma conorhini]
MHKQNEKKEEEVNERKKEKKVLHGQQLLRKALQWALVSLHSCGQQRATSVDRPKSTSGSARPPHTCTELSPDSAHDVAEPQLRGCAARPAVLGDSPSSVSASSTPAAPLSRVGLGFTIAPRDSIVA